VIRWDLPLTAVRIPCWQELMKPTVLSDLLKGNMFTVIYGWLLHRTAGSLDVLPGAEFRAAYEVGLTVRRDRTGSNPWPASAVDDDQ
jgi:hypothetical protein